MLACVNILNIGIWVDRIVENKLIYPLSVGEFNHAMKFGLFQMLKFWLR